MRSSLGDNPTYLRSILNMNKVRIAKNLIKSGALNKNNAAQLLNLLGLHDGSIEEKRNNLNEIYVFLAANNDND